MLISDYSAFDSTPHINFDDLLNIQSSNNPLQPEQQLSNSNLAIVLYTSGSTGIPKGVRLPFSIILNRLNWQWSEFPYSCTEQYGCFKTALTFVDSVSEIWGPLLNGMTIVVVPKHVTKDPVQLVNVLEQYKVSETSTALDRECISRFLSDRTFSSCPISSPGPHFILFA